MILYNIAKRKGGVSKNIVQELCCIGRGDNTTRWRRGSYLLKVYWCTFTYMINRKIYSFFVSICIQHALYLFLWYFDLTSPEEGHFLSPFVCGCVYGLRSGVVEEDFSSGVQESASDPKSFPNLQGGQVHRYFLVVNRTESLMHVSSFGLGQYYTSIGISFYCLVISIRHEIVEKYILA